jgi:hypothetical protein
MNSFDVSLDNLYLVKTKFGVRKVIPPEFH